MQKLARDFNKTGEGYYQKGDYKGALTNFLNALNLDPENIHSMNNIGVVLAKQGDYEQATEYFRMAIRQDPYYVEGFNNLGNTLRLMGFYQSAEKYLDTAIQIKPNHEGALLNLALVAEDLGNLKKAEECNFRAYAVSKEPAYLAHIYYLKRKMCQWNDLPDLIKKLDKSLKERGETPFINLIRSSSESKNLKVAKLWTKEFKNPPTSSRRRESVLIKKINVRPAPRSTKCRVGYLSETFRSHPVGDCIFELFRYHNKQKFEIFAYSYGVDDGSEIRKSIKNNTNFFDIRKKNTEDSARLIKSHSLDVIIDLQGLTKDNRIELLAQRLAPIQINYLGFPGTSGAKFIDYMITDKVAVPRKSQKFYTEKILYLNRPYQINSKLTISKEKTTRADLGLPNDRTVFCSFNRTVKIEQKMFDTWLKILGKVPGSVLWLYLDNAYAQANLLTHAIKKGVEGNRLIFADKLPIERHLARLKLADIALDTSIYSGGATTANALYVDLPVVTLKGKHYLSRMSESALAGIGLKTLVAKNQTDYINIAVRLATDRKYLTKIKDKIHKNKKLLFDTKAFTKDFERVISYANRQNTQ